MIDNPALRALRAQVTGKVESGEAEAIVVQPLKHIVSATALSTGEQLAMCGYVFSSYRAAVDAGHPVGNYIGRMPTLSAYHALGVECETCIVRHQSCGRA